MFFMFCLVTFSELPSISKNKKCKKGFKISTFTSFWSFTNLTALMEIFMSFTAVNTSVYVSKFTVFTAINFSKQAKNCKLQVTILWCLTPPSESPSS
jgi:hypothetical protein